MLRFEAVVVAVILRGERNRPRVDKGNVALPAPLVNRLRPLVGNVHAIGIHAVDREQAIHDVVQPALDEGQVGIGDRLCKTVVRLLRRA